MQRVHPLALIATAIAFVGITSQSIAAPINPVPSPTPTQESAKPIINLLQIHSRSTRHCHRKKVCRWVTRQFGGGGSSAGTTRRVRVCKRVCHTR